jgi:crotonobetainyl-CoA:carnitine CoA-transferase CaiB-like acyl-CoA transferase
MTEGSRPDDSPSGASAPGALANVRVLEIAPGVAGAYCAKLFADMGAEVWRGQTEKADPLLTHRLEADVPATEGLYHRYLNAGKQDFDWDSREFDIIILGEDVPRDRVTLPREPKIATIDVAWFRRRGDYAGWIGGDLVAQALAGFVHPAGPVDGPPMFTGEHHAGLVGGLAGYAAGVAALIGHSGSEPQLLEVSILESIMIMSEMHISQSEVLGTYLPRTGINRFVPTCPLSIHRCKTGWIGITPITPAQWRAFCTMLDLPALASDPELQIPRERYPHAARMEQEFDRKFPSKTAEEWAALGREHKVPMVVVPDAHGILQHPIFNERHSLAAFTFEGVEYRVPRTPLRLETTPPRLQLDDSTSAFAESDTATDPKGDSTATRPDEDARSPLAGVRILDFSMGWAGPLATRMLADFGAEVIKVEAGRYPDWWRAVDWSAEAIANKQFEQSRHFSALNRGKSSVSLDLTRPDGREIAKRLSDRSDVVVENQAAGVMNRLGLGYEDLGATRDDLVMLSMSAFGSGNAWSETRAYGSVLEQGSGLPSFTGKAEWPPTMAHLAYGDPIGGIYGAAAILTALYHRRRTGLGQWINNTQIEAMLPFTTPALLVRQATGREPKRLGNRHSNMVPHGCFPCEGEDRWIAIAVMDDNAWSRFIQIIGRTHWLATLATTAARRAREAEIEEVISDWTRTKRPREAAEILQNAGIAAAPVQRSDELIADPHLLACGFFYEIDRPHVGSQRQVGLPITVNGQRYPMRGLAPFLGGDSERILTILAGVGAEAFDQLVAEGLVSFAPTELRAG